ncbi:MAG: dihydroorotase [bacterium]
MPTQSFFIHNALIVNEGVVSPGSVLVKEGLIAGIFHGVADESVIPADATRIDAKGKWLIPGVIDDQVHFRDPGLTDKGDLLTESRAAVAGGVTSFMDMPNTNPRAITLDILEEKYHLASTKSLANYSFFLGASNDNIDQVLKADPEKICGLKVFMGASTGNMLVDDPSSLASIFQKSPLRIVIHSEEESIIKKNTEIFKERYGDQIPVSAHPLIRSTEACFESSRRAVELAKRYNSRLHILHLSTGKELELLDNNIPLEEKRITAEVCVHHLWFDDRDYETLGSRIKWNPAIKTEADRIALFEGLLNNKIDIIATDHAPHLMEEKQKPYLSCPSGAPLIQHSLVAMLGFHHLGKISLEKIIEKMCHAPAILYGIRGRGFIRKGFHADLALIDPDAPWTVTKENLLYKCGWSPMEGVTFRSRVTHTWVNGCLIYENGKFDESTPGERLEFTLKD